ncbi:MAG: hypothetical protein ACKOS8_18795 [Gemmataceae bacterium]
MDEVEAIARVVNLPADFEVKLPGGLTICRLAENQFHVEYEVEQGGETELREKSFKSAEAAAKFFVERRHALKLGSDYFLEDDE